MRVTIYLMTIILLCSSCTTTKDQQNPYGLSEQERSWMREVTAEQLKGCRVKASGDVWIHTPDGVGHYKALWTRDFYYMVEYAGDLIDPGEIKASIYYLLNGQRGDGCIPDRVNAEGEAIYSPGPPHKPMADHALDNGPFMAMLVCSYVNQYNDEALFREVESKLRRGLDQIKLADNGLVYNDPDNPQCVYGFTDIVKKTGNLLFSSLLYYKACMEMEILCEKFQCGDPLIYQRCSALIRQNISQLWDEKSGMFWAADVDCKQIDIWGSAYAVEIGITSRKRAEKISDYLVEHYDEIILRGQVRHLTGSDLQWQQLFHECPIGTYQNGAFWATPLAWVIPAYATRDPELAKKILQTVIQDFRENGINECINKEYSKVPNFIVSSTNVYYLTR